MKRDLHMSLSALLYSYEDSHRNWSCDPKRYNNDYLAVRIRR